MAKKILFINQEMTPYVPGATMASLGSGLPAKMQECGFEVRTFMPKWGIINERRGQLHEVIRLSGMNLVINDSDHPLIIKVASIPQSRIQVYFIDNDDLFLKRQMTLDDKGVPYTDNGERAIFFARGVLETVKKLRWTPDIIFCQGWMASVVPLYVKKVFNSEPSFAKAKVVVSLHGETLTAGVGDDFKSGLADKSMDADVLASYPDAFDYEQLLRLSIDFCDGVVVAEEGAAPSAAAYAEEKGVPVLRSYELGDGAAYRDFYNQLVAE